MIWLRMPKMDGIEVLEVLKARNLDIPLVVASGTGNIEPLAQALRLGANDYIFKPIEDMTCCIICSVYAGGINKKIVEKAGIKRFIMKPVTIASLSEQIQQLLEGNPPIIQGLTRGK